MKKEIEVKAKVSHFQDLKSKLEDIGCEFSQSTRQEDDVFENFDGDYTTFTSETNFLRIRKEIKNEKTRILFTLKRPQKNELDCIEKEVEISDAQEFEDALVLIGYHKAVSVYKNRSKTKYKDMEICLDEVDELGSFIEVEKITEGESDDVQEELFTFLESIGVEREDRVMNGYDTLMYKKMQAK